jgi:hypothetical protein
MRFEEIDPNYEDITSGETLSNLAPDIDELNLPSLWRFKWGDFAALPYAWLEPLLE